MKTRIEILNHIIKVKDTTNYLEIGVNRGKCLFNIKGAKRRFAVDPYFNFSIIKKWRYILKNPNNFKNKFFEITSDDFFKNQADMLKKTPIDLAFIDGLHTFRQSLKDTLNVLQYSTNEAIIVLHDCNPLDEIAAYPAESIDNARKQLGTHKKWKNIWNGDVWKTIVYLRKNHPELTVFVLNTDHGLGFVLKKGSNKKLPEIFNSIGTSIEEIEKLDYSFLERYRVDLLNL
ncbi:MAG: class I SAM-dependent methyltransferase, partial [Flavobacteriaceae bacterium]|nr:class I SAM-dependent methyltransferase [Flavobacteriaceae bacterium]